MSLSGILLLVPALGMIGFFVSRMRAKAVEAHGRKMHSRPHYYGWWAALLIVIPSLLFVFCWDAVSDIYLEQRVAGRVEALLPEIKIHDNSLALGVVRDLAHGLPQLPGDLSDYRQDGYSALREKLSSHGVALAINGDDAFVPLAVDWAGSKQRLHAGGALAALLLALAGFAIGFFGTRPETRARSRVERAVIGALVLASTLAIVTTIGIVLSLFFQTVAFFKVVPLADFFFGTVWDPRFSAAGSASGGQFGLLPLLAGTFYIAFVAMLFAVPVGLFAAIYMAEYASHRLRGIIKPLLEILAGIPTIVYGFFALMVVGPFLRDLSVALAGGSGFIGAQSVLTAGLVMGIMLIPFVSSLSDDIITAVPRTLRDGSLGLGATKAETTRRVVLPAALPGIAGALLLTASRAIGETMIVVLAAGVAANLTLNPFEAMTTITVKIVNQLTGDLEFNSPQTLVAFALGMTLFVLTLIMNIIALYIVRKYREQYE